MTRSAASRSEVPPVRRAANRCDQRSVGARSARGRGQLGRQHVQRARRRHERTGHEPHPGAEHRREERRPDHRRRTDPEEATSAYGARQHDHRPDRHADEADDERQHDLTDDGSERFHVLAVGQHEDPDEEGDDDGDQLRRAVGAGARGVDPQLHGDRLARRCRHRGEHRPEVGDGALVGDVQRRDDGVGDGVVHLVGEPRQRRAQVAALCPHVQGAHLVADHRWGDAGRLADRLVQPGVGHEQVAQHLRPDGDGLGAGELTPAAGAQPEQGRCQPAEDRCRQRGDHPPTRPPVGERGGDDRQPCAGEQAIGVRSLPPCGAPRTVELRRTSRRRRRTRRRRTSAPSNAPTSGVPSSAHHPAGLSRR